MKFRTDGMRGLSEDFSLEGIARIGYTLATLAKGSSIVIGHDGREGVSSLEKALVKGMRTYSDLPIYALGLSSSPHVAYETKATKSAYGVIITASHNGAGHMGVKVFDARGHKITKEKTLLERAYADDAIIIEGRDLGTSSLDESSYLQRLLLEELPSLEGEVVIDCANGGASRYVRELEEKFPFLHFIHTTPSGTNINENCGSEHPEKLAKTVVKRDALLGVGIDGDGDRIMLVDERGHIISGEHVLGFLARHKLQRQDTFVTTHDANKALDRYLLEQGIYTIRVDTGDQHICKALKEFGHTFGGEPSGHILCSAIPSCSDALLRAFEVLRFLDTSKKASEQFATFSLYPNINVNLPKVKVEPRDFSSYTSELSDRFPNFTFRVRPSGTEPIIRVRVEGKDKKKCRELSAMITEELRVS